MSDSNKIETNTTTERNATTSELAEAVQKDTHGFGVEAAILAAADEVADTIIDCPKCQSTHYSRLDCPTPLEPTIITPLHAAVLVRPDEASEQYLEGVEIYKPETSQEQPQEGTIIALPPEAHLEHRYFGIRRSSDPEASEDRPPILQLGTRIIYGKYSGAHVRAGNEDLIRLHVDDILAVVTGPRAAHVRTTAKPKPEAEAAAGPSLIQTPAQLRGEGRIIIP